MSLIRPSVARWLVPLALPSGLVVVGIWVALRGGYFLAVLGFFIATLGMGLMVTEWRRIRLAGPGADGPGFIELSEGVLRYWAAHGWGGEIALHELVEIRLLIINGRPCWQLRNLRQEALLIPADAQHASLLADAFATLPGIDLGALAEARQTAEQQDAPQSRSLWRRHDNPSWLDTGPQRCDPSSKD